MHRRILAVLVGAAALLSVTAAAEAQARVPIIGVLVLGNPDPAPFLKTFREGLRDAGYVEGESVRLEIRSAAGEAHRLPEHAADLVSRKVDVIVTYQTPPSIAAKQATREIPIILSGAGDPVGTGLVASLARPGGNVTGISAGSAEVAAKSVELIREMLPQARRIAALANEVDPFSKPFLEQIGRAARALGMELEPVMIRPGAPLEAAFDLMSAKGAEALIIQGSVLRKEVVELAFKHRLPAFGLNRVVPLSGGLMSYAGNFEAVHRETAVYVDKILKGAKPADLPVAFPTKFDLVINLRTAQTLGVTVPAALLARADEVIE